MHRHDGFRRTPIRAAATVVRTVRSREGALVIELAKVIEELRGELDAAVLAGAGKALRFDLGPIELEVAVAITREAGVVPRSVSGWSTVARKARCPALLRSGSS